MKLTGSLSLPHGSGKALRVAEQLLTRLEDLVGGEDLIEGIKNGGRVCNCINIKEIDKCIAMPQLMPRVCIFHLRIWDVMKPQFSKDGVIPDAFNSLINKKWAFKIYVGEFNLANNKDGYTISKVTDDPSIISELKKKILSLAQEKKQLLCLNILKSKKDSPLEYQITPSFMFEINELKRNLQCIYDVDEGSSQSSTKPRTCYKTDDDNAFKRVEEDGGCKGKLLIPKVEK
ncbi:hypothetical protein L1987_22990 [Smallanthus sonchifolius]|uniref:Uncharacterized protein n=1 Tax=Smallanthus sonchifolius TaxID=185202 RepID=A0ACB9IFN9_9ASTR|nr:hypothetical protein L1987_22990 [Smallanthus sonchifolius]